MKRLADRIKRHILRVKLVALRIRMHDARSTDNHRAVGDAKLQEYAVIKKLKQLEAA